MPVHAGRVPPGRKCTAMAPHPTLVTPSFPLADRAAHDAHPIGDVDVCPSRAYIPLSYHALSPHPLPDPRTYPRGRNLQPVAPTPPRTLALHRRYSSHSSPSHKPLAPHPPNTSMTRPLRTSTRRPSRWTGRRATLRSLIPPGRTSTSGEE